MIFGNYIPDITQRYPNGFGMSEKKVDPYEMDNDWDDYDSDELDEYPSRSVMRRVKIMKGEKL